MIVLAYLGPETMLPMTSAIAGIVGFLLMFGRKALELVSRVFRRKPATVAPITRAKGHRPTASRTVTSAPTRIGAESTDSSDSPTV